MRRFIATALLACLAGLTLALHDLAAETLELLAPQAAPGWLGINALTNDALSPNGAEEPDITISPDGTKMAIAYINSGASQDQSNPYFRTSTSANWDAWSSPTPIHISAPVARSFQIDIAYDAAGTGHAVWREDSSTPDNKLLYKNGSAWGNNAVNPTILSTTGPFTSLSGASTPDIEASGAATLDVVWSEDAIPNNPNILHVRSVNNGASWGTTSAIASTAGNSVVPSMAVAPTGKLHAVWEEVVFVAAPVNAFRSFIHYSQGTSAGGTSVTWSTPITISQGTNNDTSRYPDITVDDTTLYVSYTHWQDAMQAQEKAHLVRCEAGCSVQPGNWGLAAASAQFVNFNLSPNDSVLTTVAYGNGCAYVQYDGIPSGSSQLNEIIWGTSSCDAAPDAVTSISVQSTTPDAAISGEWIHMAYEQKGSGNRHVYYVRGKLPYYVYQPVIRKGN